MDYSGIINLVLVTIIYSTFIAPNLKKLSDIRSQISDLQFSERPRDLANNNESNGYRESVRKNTETLNKKFSQYRLIYHETNLFLVIFYITLAIIFGVQVWVMVSEHLTNPENPVTFPGIMYMVLAFIVVVLLGVAMRIFMVPPHKIRTLRWLYDVGVAEIYSLDMYDPLLWIGQRHTNFIDENGATKIDLSSAIPFVGNRIILTIESLNGNSIFAVIAGQISHHARTMTSDSNNGKRLHTLRLIEKVKLKKGTYKARLIMFGAVYRGTNSPVELIIEFEVGEQGALQKYESINLDAYTKKYSYVANDKGYITSIDFATTLTKSSRLKELLSVDTFIDVTGKLKGLVQLFDANGTLTKEDFEKKFSKRHVKQRRFVHWLRKLNKFKTKKRRGNVTF